MGLTLFLQTKTLTMWLIFLLVANAGAKRTVTAMPQNVFPVDVIDYVLVDPPSICMCRLKCIINSSCTAVSLYINEGSVTCSFSNVAIDLASLSSSEYDYTFIYNVSQPTADPTSLSVTETSAVSAPITTSASTAMSASTTTPAHTTTSATTTSTSEAITTSASTTLAPSTTTTFSSTSSSTPVSLSTSTTSTTSTSVSTTMATTTTLPVTNCNAQYWRVFNGTCYSQMGILSQSWAGAILNCGTYSSSLIQITSPEELSFIQKSLRSDPSWIALKRDATGAFRWDADMTEPVVTNWDDGEPSSGDCVYMLDGKWKTADCWRFLNFFCEKPGYIAYW